LEALRTSASESDSVTAALRRAAEDCSFEREVEIRVSTHGMDRELHPIARDEVYRIGYEAIRKACMHSGGTELHIGRALYAEYAGDLFLAWLFGIAFQYFTIKPMRNLSPIEGLKAALKSDTLAIITFEIGLFAWMALMYFVFFPHPHLKPTEATYWFMMQIGMVLGFLTSYPMNRWLIKVGWKAVMG
jgi:hypothetical protein